MKDALKFIINIPIKIFINYTYILRLFSSKAYFYSIRKIEFLLNEKKKTIKIDNKKIHIYTPNELCEFRADTFFSKEPETIRWIKKNGKNKILFDIGANIGLYSIYHSVINSSKCYAFEPSVFNLVQLTKNININGCNDYISVITNPLSNKNSIEIFNYSSMIEGGALSSFGVNFDYSGNEIDKKLSLNKLGFSLDELVFNSNYFIDKPNLIKIDVDGIEHLILEGATKTLKEKSCNSVLVEINDNFEEQKIKSEKILSNCGFKLEEKNQSDFTTSNLGFERTFNQIWYKT